MSDVSRMTEAELIDQIFKVLGIYPYQVSYEFAKSMHIPVGMKSDHGSLFSMSMDYGCESWNIKDIFGNTVKEIEYIEGKRWGDYFEEVNSCLTIPFQLAHYSNCEEIKSKIVDVLDFLHVCLKGDIK